MHDFETDPRAPVRGPAPRTTAEPAGTIRPVPGATTAAGLMHLQRTAGNAGVVQMLGEEGDRSPVHDVVGRGGGAALDAATRGAMESRFGADFGDVRVHTGEPASRSAEAVGANAYTVGSDIVFRSGHFDPGTPTGQRTLAHELAHVVQQRSGPVDGSEAPGGIRLSHPGDRFEQAAEQTADTVMAGGTPSPAPATAASPSVQTELEDPGAAPAVQRQEVPEEEEELGA